MPPRLNSLIKFVEPATILAISTACLYFLGYAYFNAFCERLGFRFHGISIPLQDYLVVSWQAIFITLLILIILLFVAELIWNFVNWLSARLKKKKGQGASNESDSKKLKDSSLGYIKLGLFLIYFFYIYLNGAKSTMELAQHDADTIKKEARPIVIRDADGTDLKGSFVYLRDFGQELVVAEISDDKKTILGIRVIKAGHYSSYTLNNN